MLSHFSCVRLRMTLWTATHYAPLSTGFSRQEYWHGLTCLPPGTLLNPEIEPVSPGLQVDSLPLSYWGKLELPPLGLLILRPLDSGWNYSICPPGSPACKLQISRLVSLHNHVVDVLVINLFVHMYIHIWASLVAQTVKNLPAMQ